MKHPALPPGALARPVIVYNNDWEARVDAADAPPTLAADAEVLETALAVRDALAAVGVSATLDNVADDVGPVLRRLKEGHATVVVNLVESLGGLGAREPEFPEALEAAGLPYTGNGPAALRAAQAKDVARQRMLNAGVPVPRGLVVWGPDDALDLSAAGVSFPLFVKPARVDGSIGIDQRSRVRSLPELRERLAFLAAGLPGPFLVEEYLPGTELNVSIFPDPIDGLVSATTIDFSAFGPELVPVVTYDCKWTPGSPEYVAGSKKAEGRVPAALLAEATAIARRAFVALGATSYGRVDLRADADGVPRVMDVNTNPDVHPDSGFVKTLRYAGLGYPELALGILEGAFRRSR